MKLGASCCGGSCCTSLKADAPGGEGHHLRFGLEDGRARTLEELGKEFNVTRERVRQIEAKALRKPAPPQPRKAAAGLSGRVTHSI